MDNRTHRHTSKRLAALAFVGFLTTILVANGCGSDTAGYGCYSDEDCSDDLSCETNQQGAVCSEGFCGCDYQQGICSQYCDTDDDCPYDLVCNKSSTCGGEPDLCGRP